MVNEYQIIINSTEDIQKELSKAEESGIVYDYYNAVIYLRGSEGSVIEVGRSLKGLYVVAQGPAEVRVTGGSSVMAEGSTTVHAYEISHVIARGHSTVFAYDEALVDLEDSSTCHLISPEAEVLAADDSRVILPKGGDIDPEDWWVELRDNAAIAH